ncbi:hypothetical protein I0C86_08425 [Plantactinospora sp. S1510]|uniref:Secreted protein n=1 Tax=Plantactinospora alkalitolerans TaxID=2789879 RepID=A0ABS0GSL9_9ACTN|nr:hypothetical protein [Plantactinospora alkalitolerans]MBF9129009.1 hypothetical protein [Plantactinospora alkalitolerans]
MQPPTRIARLVAPIVTFCLAGTLTGSVSGFDVTAVPEPPADRSTLVIQLREWESLTPPYERAELPEFTLYGGGRVIAGGHWDGSVYRAREHTLSPDRYRQIYRLAHAAGLARSVHLDQPVPATDGSLLVASLRTAGRLHTTTLVSPGETDVGARRRIIEFRRTVRLLALSTDPTRVADYRPSRLAVLVTGGWSGSPGDAGSIARQWPGPDLLAGVPTRVGLCTVAGSAGPDAEALGRDAPLTTRWHSGGKWLSVAVRPLLPDEYDCADLDRRTP